jgi:hypothetical protein
MDTRQLTSPQGEADGVSDGGMTLQALGGGEFALRLVSRQRVALRNRWSRSHTHTHTHIEDLKEANKPRLWNSLPAAATEFYIQDTRSKLETPLACPPGGPEE